jgi:hypothetical protein
MVSKLETQAGSIAHIAGLSTTATVEAATETTTASATTS